MQNGQQGWVVDKKISITALLAAMIQTATIVWYAAKLDSRVASIEDKIQITAQQSQQIADLRVSVARLEGKK